MTVRDPSGPALQPLPVTPRFAPTPARLDPRLKPLFARHFLQVFSFNCVLWALQMVAVPGSWDVKFVYSQAIGLSIWALIDFGRFVLRPDATTGWPDPPPAIALVVVGIVGGYTLGTFIGDWYCGCSTWEWWTLSPRRLAATVAGTLFASSVAVYFFFARGRAAHQAALLAASERDATLARLTLLQAQLEPHMLFNTLANLRVLISLDPARAQAMLDRLIAYLRATLSASRASTHSLAAEFERLDDFLALMAVRMGERLRTEFTLPAELRALAVPPLLLQPLVENAIKHGLEPKVEGGRIHVSARLDGARLELSVRDTGLGARAAAPSGPPLVGSPPGATPAATRFGLQQVRERLATLYGEQADFTLEAADDAEGGMRARIRLPQQQSETNPQ